MAKRPRGRPAQQTSPSVDLEVAAAAVQKPFYERSNIAEMQVRAEQNKPVDMRSWVEVDSDVAQMMNGGTPLLSGQSINYRGVEVCLHGEAELIEEARAHCVDRALGVGKSQVVLSAIPEGVQKRD